MCVVFCPIVVLILISCKTNRTPWLPRSTTGHVYNNLEVVYKIRSSLLKIAEFKLFFALSWVLFSKTVFCDYIYQRFHENDLHTLTWIFFAALGTFFCVSDLKRSRDDYVLSVISRRNRRILRLFCSIIIFFLPIENNFKIFWYIPWHVEQISTVVRFSTLHG